MATQYTPILQLALPVTGELNGTWGNVVNDNITSMIEQAIAGMATINTWAGGSHTLTTADGTTDEARCAMLIASGSPGTDAQIICPTRTKMYIVTNSITGGYAVTLKTAAGTGVSVANGSSALLYCNGTDVVTAVSPQAAVLTTPVSVVGSASAGAEIRLPEDTDNGSNYVALKAANTLASNLTFTLPATDGTSGQVMSTNGAGQLSFTSVSLASPLAVGGSNTAGAEIRLPEDTDNGSNYVALKAPDNLATTFTLTLPTADGTNGQLIQTNGSGQLSFASVSLASPLAVVGNATAGAEIRLPEDTDNGANYVALKAPDTLASNLTFTLPSADGTSGQAIVTNGSGQLSFGASGVSTGKAIVLSMIFGGY